MDASNIMMSQEISFPADSNTLCDETQLNSIDPKIDEKHLDNEYCDEASSTLIHPDESESKDFILPHDVCEPQLKIEPMDCNNQSDYVNWPMKAEFLSDCNGSSSEECETISKRKWRATSSKHHPDGIDGDFQCPICDRRFLTSYAKNGHLTKFHKQPLGETFTCDVCGALGSSRAFLKRHLKRSHGIQEADMPDLLAMECSFCKSKFPTKRLLCVHMKEEHQEEIKDYFKCDWCPLVVKYRSSLQCHMRRAHAGKEMVDEKRIKCDLCEEWVANRHYLRIHKKAAHKQNRTCDICNRQFRYYSALERHRPTHERANKKASERETNGNHQCEVCGKTFKTKRSLTGHVTVKHVRARVPVKRSYDCRMCNQTFSSAYQNRLHYRRTHFKERSKTYCFKCKIQFKTVEECKEHRKTHPLFCDICNKQFLTSTSLREHRLIHFKPKHKCPFCEKCFIQKSNMTRHIRVHTGEKPFKCRHCGRTFADSSACKGHELVHTSSDRYTCPYCNVSYTKKQKLKYHLRIHTGRNLMHCPLCMKVSTHSYSLKKHIQSHQVTLTKALVSLGFKTLLDADSLFVPRALQELFQIARVKTQRQDKAPNLTIGNSKAGDNEVKAETSTNIDRESLNSSTEKDLNEENVKNVANLNHSSPGRVESKSEEGARSSVSDKGTIESTSSNSVKPQSEQVLSDENALINETEITTRDKSMIIASRDDQTSSQTDADMEPTDQPTVKMQNTHQSSGQTADQSCEEKAENADKSSEQSADQSSEQNAVNGLDPYKDVIKFLKSLLEKASVKVNSQKRKRKSRKKIKVDSSLFSSQSSKNRDIDSEDEEELPTTVDENFMEKCLQVVLKEEKEEYIDEDEQNTGEEYGSFNFVNVNADSENYDESDSDDSNPEFDPLDVNISTDIDPEKEPNDCASNAIPKLKVKKESPKVVLCDTQNIKEELDNESTSITA